MSNAIDLIVQDKAIKGLDGLIVKLQKAHEEIQKINAKGIEFNKSSNNGGLKSTITLTEEYNKLVKANEVAVAKSKLTHDSLNKSLIKMREEKRVSTQLTKQQIRAESDLAGAYAKLNAQLIIAEKEYRDLASSQGLSNKATLKSQKEVLKLRNRLDDINKPIKRWNSNVGNYASGLRSLAGALGWAGLTYAMVNGVSATYETIKVYDALNKSLEKVTSSQAQANSEMNFVIDISDRFGLSLRNTTKDYVSFLASAKGTNLEGEKARKIFNSVAKSSATMGLSAEETSGTLKALNQIMSKGKVQAEELRGQLGDRIPGAFQIMARALGVTTSKLDEMLKKGELMADEVLPRFAEEMEKTFGIQNVNRIDTLVSAQNRLSTAWDKFILSIENGDGVISKFIRGTLNFLSEELNKLSKLVAGFDGEMESAFTRGFDSANKVMDESTKGYGKNSKALEQYLTIREKRVKQTMREIALTKTAMQFDGLDEAKGKKKIKDLTLQIKWERGFVDAIKQRIKALNTAKKVEANDGAKKLTTAKAVNRAEEKSIKNKIESNSYIGLEIELYDILNDKAYQNNVITAEGAIEREKRLKALQDQTQQYLQSVGTGAMGDFGFSSLTTFFDGTFDDLLEGADTVEDKFAVTFNAIANVAKDAFNLISSFSQKNYDKQLENISSMEQIRLQFANGSATAEAEISRQAEAERKKVQKNQAEAQKKQALFGIGITTAQATVSAYASQLIPGDPTSVIRAQIFAGIVAGLGLAQMAVVASQEIPQFKDGVRDFGGGMAIVGDGGVQEVIETRDGISLTPKTDTLVNLPKGANVYKNKQEFFNERMNNVLINNGIQPITNVRQQNGFDEEKLANLIGNQIKKIPRGNAVMNFDQKGINTYWDNGITKKKMLNSRVRGLGRNT